MSAIAERNKQTVSDILIELIKYQGITVSELARRILIPQPTIQRIVSGLHSRPHRKTLDIISKYFEISVDQLCGKEQIPWLGLKVRNEIKLIPLLENEQVISWPRIGKQKLNYICIDIDSGKNTFATTMPDGSMEPVIAKNSILIVDPEKIAGYRSFVVIHFKQSNEILVRQMIKDANKFYIRALSPDFTHISMSLLNTNSKILGIIVEVRVHPEN